MKKILLLFFISCWISISFAQDEDQQLFRSGAEYYHQNNYIKAISNFKQLIKEGYESAIVYYNLGNSYAKLKNNSEAIWAYEKALKLDPHLTEAKDNLQVLNKAMDNEIIHIEPFFLIRWWKVLIQFFHPNIWAIMCLLTMGVWMFMLTAKWLRKLTIATKFIVYSLIFWLIIFSVTTASYLHYNSHSQAIIIDNNISMHIGPDDRSDEVQLLPPGLKITIIDKIDDWYKIQLPDLTKGWIHKDDSREI